MAETVSSPRSWSACSISSVYVKGGFFGPLQRFRLSVMPKADGEDALSYLAPGASKLHALFAESCAYEFDVLFPLNFILLPESRASGIFVYYHSFEEKFRKGFETKHVILLFILINFASLVCTRKSHANIWQNSTTSVIFSRDIEWDRQSDTVLILSMRKRI